jgi:hypothetical protein
MFFAHLLDYAHGYLPPSGSRPVMASTQQLKNSLELCSNSWHEFWTDFIESILGFKDPNIELSTRFPLLEVLKLDTRYLSLKISNGGSYIHLSKLHTLEIKVFHARNRIELYNLTTLRISENFEGGSLAFLLAKCPLLQNLHVGSFRIRGPYSGEVPSSPIYHSRLSTLSVTQLELCAMTSFQSVLLPSLINILGRQKCYIG